MYVFLWINSVLAEFFIIFDTQLLSGMYDTQLLTGMLLGAFLL